MVIVKNERILFTKNNFIKNNIFHIFVLLGIGLNQCTNSEVFYNVKSSPDISNIIFDSQSSDTFSDIFEFKKVHNTSLLKANLLLSVKAGNVMDNNMKVLSCNGMLQPRDISIFNNTLHKSKYHSYISDNYTSSKSHGHEVTKDFVLNSGYQINKPGMQSILKVNTSSYNIFNIYKNANNNKLQNNILQVNIYEHNSNRFFNLSFIDNSTKSLNLRKTKVSKNKLTNNPNTLQSKYLSINEIIKQTESNKNIPSGLLKAIGKVESGLQPYAINYNGRGYLFSNKESALIFVNSLIKRGITNFSVGCFQLHYKSHRNKFSSVNSMFDPASNAEYAAKLLNRLYREGGNSWSNAIKRYHAGGSYRNSIYYSKIVRILGRTI